MSGPAWIIKRPHSMPPKIKTCLRYNDFIQGFIRIQEYRQAFSTMEKADFDHIYQLHLRKILGLEKKSVRYFHREVRPVITGAINAGPNLAIYRAAPRIASVYSNRPNGVL